MEVTGNLRVFQAAGKGKVIGNPSGQWIVKIGQGKEAFDPGLTGLDRKINGMRSIHANGAADPVMAGRTIPGEGRNGRIALCQGCMSCHPIKGCIPHISILGSEISSTFRMIQSAGDMGFSPHPAAQVHSCKGREMGNIHIRYFHIKIHALITVITISCEEPLCAGTGQVRNLDEAVFIFRREGNAVKRQTIVGNTAAQGCDLPVRSIIASEAGKTFGSHIFIGKSGSLQGSRCFSQRNRTIKKISFHHAIAADNAADRGRKRQSLQIDMVGQKVCVKVSASPVIGSLPFHMAAVSVCLQLGKG